MTLDSSDGNYVSICIKNVSKKKSGGGKRGRERLRPVPVNSFLYFFSFVANGYRESITLRPDNVHDSPKEWRFQEEFRHAIVCGS